MWETCSRRPATRVSRGAWPPRFGVPTHRRDDFGTPFLNIRAVLVTLDYPHPISMLPMLTAAEKDGLISIARRAIEKALRSPMRHPLQRGGEEEIQGEGRLRMPGGAFVTLKVGHRLRGCIGYIESPEPLAHTVAKVAVKSAFEDPRFPPLAPEEYEKVSVEISVLTPPQEVTNLETIKVGKHGLIVELGRARGLLLPQVAVEYGWDSIEFLCHTAQKAGLPPQAWKDPRARIFAFSAEVIEEGEPHGAPR